MINEVKPLVDIQVAKAFRRTLRQNMWISILSSRRQTVDPDGNKTKRCKRLNKFGANLRQQRLTRNFVNGLKYQVLLTP